MCHIRKTLSKIEKQFVGESAGNVEFGVIKIQLVPNR